MSEAHNGALEFYENFTHKFGLSMPDTRSACETMKGTGKTEFTISGTGWYSLVELFPGSVLYFR